MKKKYAALFCLLLTVLILVGCGAKESVTGKKTETESATAIITDNETTKQTSSQGLTEKIEDTEGSEETGTQAVTQTEPSDPFLYREMTAEDFQTLTPLFYGKGAYGHSVMGLLNVFENRGAPEGETPVQVLNTSLLLKKDALDAFEKLQSVLNRTYPEFSILLVCCQTSDGSGLRCKANEDELFDHCTGYTADLWFYYKRPGSTAASMQIGEAGAAEQSAYFIREAAKLGIIESYASVQGRSADDLRHFRYVGVPHALFIYENALTFDGYMEEVKTHTASDPLVYTPNGSAEAYGIYFVKAKNDGSATIPLYRDCASAIESNGTDGYVVSFLYNSDPPFTPSETGSGEPTASSAAETQTADPDLPTVYVDAGHGFASKSGVYDNGAGEGSIYNTLSGGLYEADLDLQIALLVEKKLTEKGYSVIMSRTSPSMERLPISARAERAKAAGADLLVSIHANSAENPSACGARVYYNQEYDKAAESKALAAAIGKEIDRLCPSALSTGLINGSHLAMLNGTGSIPSILVETCFLTNEKDARNAIDPEWQDKMAEAIVTGIINR